jgi:hypothetical protein
MTGGVDMWRMRLLRRFLLSIIKVIDRAAPRNDRRCSVCCPTFL